MRDVRALMRLTHELHELAPNPIARNEHMLAELCRMTGARVAASAIIDLRALETPTLVFVTYVGLDSTQSLAAANRYLRTLDPPDPVWRPMFQSLRAAPSKPTTRLRHHLVHDNEWYGSAHYDEVRRPAEIDHALYSVFPNPRQGQITALILNRCRCDAHPFTARDRRLVHTLHGAILWLFRPQQAAQNDGLAPDSLSPRQRQTLRCLLSGDSEKQIAARIGLSPHTVHIYVKAIYRNYGVSTRGELLAKFVHGRG
jgi:DNA-binding CsgD family transcriptional regulator